MLNDADISREDSVWIQEQCFAMLRRIEKAPHEAVAELAIYSKDVYLRGFDACAKITDKLIDDAIERKAAHAYKRRT